QMHVAKTCFVSQGIKLSAEVKPFVPKHAAETMAQSEPSAACVFPRYLTTCYPFVQEPSVENLPQDDVYSLSQCPSHSVLGDPAFCEYSSCSYSPDVSNVYTVPGSQCCSNNSRYTGSGIVSESAERMYPIRQESKNLSKQRRSKENEKKLGKKKHDGDDTSVRIVNKTSFQTFTCSRDSLKSDRFNKTTNKKSTQTPKAQSLPVPALEATILDFHKSQSLESSEILNIQHKNGQICSAESNITVLYKQTLTSLDSLVLMLLFASVRIPKAQVSLLKCLEGSSKDKAIPEILKSPANVFSLNFILGSYALKQSSSGSSQQQVSWAMVLTQPPKKIVSSPSSESLPRGRGKQDSQTKQSEIKNDASGTELEEESEKKKKKRKKKKKLNSPTDVEKPQSEATATQEPPRIEDAEEFPDLAAASDRRSRLGSQKLAITPAVRKQPEETPRNSGKKSQIPVQLDLGGMLAVLEQKQQTEKSKQSSKPVVFSVGGAIPLLSKEPAAATKSHRLNQGKMPHNPLDSSAPLVKKGKQREVPKAKRPTALKKIILKEREQRKQQHLLEQTAVSKDEDNICQSAENTTEDETFLQDGQAAAPVTQVAEGFPEDTGKREFTEGSMISKQLTPNLPKIHSRNFRDYCSQVLSKEVDSCVTDLLKELVRFQDRLYQKDPVKAKIKRRLVMGLREVLKHLKLKKLKCVIISPNCEKIQSKGGLDETLHNIIDCACEQNIPFVFALNRKALGRCVNKAVPVSVVGIFSYDGAQDHFHRMVQLTTEARKAYKDMITALEEEAEGKLRETQSTILATDFGKDGLSEVGKTFSKDSDEDVPNYIKIWKRKLEEEYNPYALELEKSAAADMVVMNSEEH
ncbi:Selenocysteine insertion sequence-binding protein 2, partial [Calypte anna]